MEKDPADPHNLATRPEQQFQTVEIGTAGMRSEDAVQKAAAAARGVDGVQEVHADFAGASLRVTYDPAKTDVPAIHDAIGRTGYQAAPVTNPELLQPGPENL